ncbi:hypothetical protein BST12_15125 [Mycobacterium angelicum]|uniref:Uncharacterized protein n=1 Tax=Mycobacterium angelicum TaxID=470074 RepID=A0A1W9ZRS1_MYCAN|nr:hypothetical protein BST12_15125 [Mycobacterium angelicum]
METPDSAATTPATGQPSQSDRSDRPGRLDQIWAVVGITAGVVFVVAVIFFSGFFLGRATDNPYGSLRVSDGGRDGVCPMMGSDGGMTPGRMGPGGPMTPGQTATPTPQPMPHP